MVSNIIDYVSNNLKISQFSLGLLKIYYVKKHQLCSLLNRYRNAAQNNFQRSFIMNVF